MKFKSYFSKKYDNNLELDWTKRNFPDLMKPENFFLGGDGLSDETPVFLNCRTSNATNNLISLFISQKHGKEDEDWTTNFSCTLKSDKTICGMIKAITINTKDSEITYYFDLSRMMNVVTKLHEQLNGG